jgi:hypothetical protein
VAHGILPLAGLRLVHWRKRLICWHFQAFQEHHAGSVKQRNCSQYFLDKLDNM